MLWSWILCCWYLEVITRNSVFSSFSFSLFKDIQDFISNIHASARWRANISSLGLFKSNGVLDKVHFWKRGLDSDVRCKCGEKRYLWLFKSIWVCWIQKWWIPKIILRLDLLICIKQNGRQNHKFRSDFVQNTYYIPKSKSLKISLMYSVILVQHFTPRYVISLNLLICIKTKWPPKSLDRSIFVSNL